MQPSVTTAPQDAVLGIPDLRELYEDHAAAIRSLARRLVGPDGEVDDVVHDAFLIVCDKRARLTRKTALSFLFSTTIKVAAGRRRRAQFRRFLGLEKAPEVADWRTPERAAEQGDTRRIVHAILETIPEKRRVVFILHALQGMTCEEIASMLGRPVETIWTRYYKARQEFVEGVRALRRRGLLREREGEA